MENKGNLFELSESFTKFFEKQETTNIVKCVSFKCTFFSVLVQVPFSIYSISTSVVIPDLH